MVLWLKAGHIVAVIAWMAAILYLPRLFVYHSMAAIGSELSETLKVMERRLSHAIMTPAMIASLALGIWLAHETNYWRAPWLHGKLVMVGGLVVVHVYLLRSLQRFARDERPGSSRFWRVTNEIPTLLMIAVVILVVVKPFG